jgi:cytochrome b561
MAERMGYTMAQKVLHWVIAILVLFMILSGVMIGSFDNKPGVEAGLGAGSFDLIYDLHKNVGLPVLFLMLLRIALRLTAGAPPYEPPLAAHERIGAAAVHGLLYLLLVLAPLTGWLIISAFPALPLWFGLFPVPGLIAPDATPDRPVYNMVLGPHEVMGWTIILLVIVHVGAALWHGFVKRDGVLARMTR